MTHVDASVGVDRHHPVKILMAATENLGGFDDDIFGPELMLWNCGGKTKQFWTHVGLLLLEPLLRRKPQRGSLTFLLKMASRWAA
jgi:hypothetical protein